MEDLVALTFASAEELIEQMRNDLIETRAWARQA